MRLLYVTNGFPYPLTSGYLRHYFLIRELARWHRITLLSVVTPAFAAEHAAALAPYTERVLTFPSARHGTWPGTVMRRAQAALGAAPELIAMRAALQQLLRERTYDAILFSGKTTYQAIAGLDLPPMIADMCDATSMRLKGELRYARPLKQLTLWFRYAQTCRIERAILERSGHVVFASARDRRVVVDALPVLASVVPNGVNVDYWHRSVPRLGQNTIIFTGAMHYPPNSDAALHLVHDILPMVRRSVPEARLLIVGHSPVPALVEAGRQPGVTVTGFVHDVRPYLEQATVFVSPLRFGAGIQNKLLEALSMELPTVASPLAADSLCTESGECAPLRVAESAEECAHAIVQRLISGCREPVREGRQFVEDHFSWRRGGEVLNEILQEAVCAVHNVA